MKRTVTLFLALAACTAMSSAPAPEPERPPAPKETPEWPDLPEVSAPQMPRHAASAKGFVPEGWRLEHERHGDLNGDGATDLAFIIRGSDPALILPVPMCAETLDTNPRTLAVAVRQADGGYVLVTDSEELIPRHESPCAADVLESPDEFAIRGGALHIQLYRFYSMGSWETSTTSFAFRLLDEEMVLIGFDTMSATRNSGEMRSVSVNYLTGRAKLTAGRIDTDRERVRWVDLHHRRKISLASVGNGLEFDPEDLVSGFE